MPKKISKSSARRRSSPLQDEGCSCEAGRTFVGLVKYAIVLGPNVVSGIVNKYRLRIAIPLTLDNGTEVAPKGHVREEFFLEQTVFARFKNLCAACGANIHILLNCIGLHYLEDLSASEQVWISGWWAQLAI